MNTTSYRTLLPLFTQLQGEHVLVRPYREEDAQTVKDAVDESREHIRPWLPFADAHQTIEETRDWIIHTTAKWLLREDMTVSIWEKDSNRFLGGSGLHPRDWEVGHFEIGYWLRASATGKGYITETARLLTTYAFEHLNANRIQIRCDERNTPSANVARRLGFLQEGRLRNDAIATDGQLRNTLVFSKIRGEQ